MVDAVQHSVIVSAVGGLHCDMPVGFEVGASAATCDTTPIERRDVKIKDIVKIVNTLYPTECLFTNVKHTKKPLIKYFSNPTKVLFMLI
jgi:hypothetical protein